MPRARLGSAPRAEPAERPVALTNAERECVDEEFRLLKRYTVPEPVADQFRRLVTARGLASYANRQVIAAGPRSGEGYHRELFDKAIVAISKAYHLCSLPMYLYDMATFLEMSGQHDLAQEAFRQFLDKQAGFSPSEMEVAFLGERNLEEAVRNARSKLGLSAVEQYPAAAAATPVAPGLATCDRCGGEIRPQVGFCESCGPGQTVARVTLTIPGGIGPPSDLADLLSRRPANSGNWRLVFGVISVVVFGIIAVVAVVIGLAHYGAQSEKGRGGAQVGATPERRGQIVGRRSGSPSAEEVARLLDAEKAHATIVGGAADLHRWLARDSADDTSYRPMIEAALNDMSAAVAVQREAEDSERPPSRGRAYRAWLDCVGVEIDAFIERYNRGEIGAGPAAKEEALAPLNAAVAGYDAAYRGALAMPPAEGSGPGATEGGKEIRGEQQGAPETDQMGTPEHPESETSPGEGGTSAAPEAGSEPPQAGPAPE